MAAKPHRLPAEGRSKYGSMQHRIDAVLAMRTGLAKIHRKRAIAEHGVKRHAEAHRVVAVGRDHLPRKFAPCSKPAHIPFKRKLLSRGDLVPDASAHDRIDPFQGAGPGNRPPP